MPCAMINPAIAGCVACSGLFTKSTFIPLAVRRIWVGYYQSLSVRIVVPWLMVVQMRRLSFGMSLASQTFKIHAFAHSKLISGSKEAPLRKLTTKSASAWWGLVPRINQFKKRFLIFVRVACPFAQRVRKDSGHTLNFEL